MRSAPALVCAVAGVLLAGCGGSPAGSPAPEAESSAARSSPATSSAVQVPKVTDPIDMTQYKKQPCSTLTEGQLEKLSIPTEPEARPDAPGGPTCEWNAYDETGIVISGRPLTAGSSLAYSYKKNQRGGYENFEPTTFADYPGYIRWHNDDQCTAVVAVQNDLLYSVVVRVNDDMSYYGKQCQVAEKAATLATKTMSGRT